MRITKALAVAAAVITFGLITATAATAAPSTHNGEYAARVATHIPTTVKYDGSYDRMSKTVVCYEGRAAHRTTYRGITVHTRHYVQYCTDGWVSIQGLNDHWKDVAPHACKNEDSTNCYWDATRHGNHKGHSFYATKHCVFYTDKTYAEAQNYCTNWS